MSLTVSSPPFIKSDISANDIFWATVAALLPVMLISGYVFGIHPLLVFGVGIASAVGTEFVIHQFLYKKPKPVGRGAIITGILIPLLLPYNVPLWVPAAGSIFAIAIVREAFGGTGSNIFNPALLGWIFIMMAWATYTVTLPGPYPHSLIINYNAIRLSEVSPILIVLPPLFLIIIKYIDWRIPTTYLASTVLFLYIFKQSFELATSGIFLMGVFLFATDPITSPVTKKGRIIFGIGCGLLTVLYAMYASYVEGIGLSILLMNAVTPLIDRFTIPKPIIAEELYEDLR